MGKKVFLLTHVHEVSPEQDDIKIVGIYSTEAQAQAAAARSKLPPGFERVPEGFHIDAYQLDKDHWLEGFSTAVPQAKPKRARTTGARKARKRS